MSFRRRAVSAALTALLGAGTSVVALAPPAAADTFVVSTTADGGAGSLRDAVAQASAGGSPNEIVLQAGATYVLDDCGEGDLDHTGTQPLTIVGNGATIDQTCAGERVIETDTDLTVRDTTITGGTLGAGIGGGIEADTADVTLVRSTVIDNEAPTGGGVAAIRVTLVESTVAGNRSTSTGGGVWADQTVEATNSTVTGNEAVTAGGGITVVNTSITLLYATVAGNTAPAGANLQLQPGSDELISFGAAVGLPAGGGDDCDLAGGVTTTSQGGNFSSDASCGFGGGTDDVASGGDPQLGALAANGGPTDTLLPAAGSVLIDGVACDAAPSVVATDQRGVARPQGGRCDIGAVEVEVESVTTTTAAGTGTPGTDPASTGGAPLSLTG